jgi:LuxR family maltose regulon positive regulatory protein
MRPTILEVDIRVEALIDSASFVEAAVMLGEHWPEYLDALPGELRERILSLPDEVWSANPALLLALGSSLRAESPANPFAALPYLDAADLSIEGDPAGASPELGVQALLARAATERSLGRIWDARHHAIAAGELLEALQITLPRKISLQGLVLLELGVCLALLGDFHNAGLRLRHGLALWQGAPNGLAVEGMGCLALVDYFTASAAAPRAHTAEARMAAERSGLLERASGAPLRIVECMLAVDEGDSERAQHYLDGLRATAAGTAYEVLALHAESVLLGIRVGPLEQLEALQEIQIILNEWQAPTLAHYVHDSSRIGSLIQLGAISAARDAIAVMPPMVDDSDHALCAARLIARLHLHTGDFDGVLAATAECRALGDKHAPRSLAYIDALRCAAHAALGDAGTAASCVDRALFAAARSGWRRHLTSLPHDSLQSMLDGARERPQTDETLAALEDLASSLVPDFADSIAPLSARERLILHHLVAGETRQQISSRLRVSPNTIKTQVRSIYRKLGAANRHEAIDRATKYGITV